jgi:hypothetical protein
MTKQAKVIITVLIIAVIGFVIYKNISIVSRDKAGNIVGGDRDEHGCIGSAGYSWCEAKQKCLRIWEEKCDSVAELEVQRILANKYQKAPSEVSVTVIRSDGSHAAGSVMFGESGPGESGMFLAVKTGDKWEVVYDGNGSIDCNKMRQQYQFPDEILRPEFCD